MFSSFFQLMGFPTRKPVNSRANEVAQSQSSNAGAEAISQIVSDSAANARQPSISDINKQNKSARRLDVNAKTVKTKEAPKATHEVVKGKPSIKAVAKPVAQPKAKSTAKTAPAAKSAPRAVAKPTASKAAPVKPSVPTKIVGKEPKPASKAVVKVTKVVKASPIKVVKPAAIIQAKDSVKTTLAKAAKPEVAA